MPFTLDQLNFLVVKLDVAIPPTFIENKRLEEEYKKRETDMQARGQEMRQRSDGEKLQGLFNQATAAGTGKNFVLALKLLDRVEAGLAAPDPGAAIKGALLEWDVARAGAIAQLKQLGDAIKGFKHPESEKAIILVRAIQANLTEKPDTLQSVSELERYLESDDIISEAEEPNGFGITVELRKPLLQVLEKLKPLFNQAETAHQE